MTRARLLMLCALAGAALLGCKEAPAPIHIPGDEKTLQLTMKFAQLGAAELNAVGSFNLTLLHNGDVERVVPLNFNTSTRALSFIDEPADLPTGGSVSVQLQAVNVAGSPLGIGGAAGPLDLDAVDPDGSAELVVLVGRLDAATPLATLATGREQPGVAVSGGGLLVFGGRDNDGVVAAPEWHDLARGVTWTAEGDGCALGDVPAAREQHVMLALADGFAPGCPQRDAILVGLGQNAAGDPLTDAALFSAAGLEADGAFTALPAGLQPRVGGWAVALRGCAVLIGGGLFDTDVRDDVDVLRFSAEGVTIENVVTGVAGINARAVPTRNALDEVIVMGGELLGEVPTESAFTLRLDGDGLSTCDTSSAGCNGAAADFCGGVPTLAAPIDDGSDFSPALVLTECGATIFRSAEQAPFSAFNALSAANVPAALPGATLSPFGVGAAVLAGGVDGAQVADVVRFDLQAVAEDAAQGAFTPIGDLVPARAFHGAVPLGAAVILVSGLGAGATYLTNIDVLVPSPE